MNESPRIEKLRRDHHVDPFDCGQEALNRFLIRYAFQNQQAEASQTYVALIGAEVVGFYTLVVAQLDYDGAPQRLAKGLARHPIPLMLLARLAVATSWQGHGLGAGLLKDAMVRTLQAADIAGIRAIAVHAKDDAARAFYERFGFVQAPTDPYHLFVLLKDVRAILNPRSWGRRRSRPRIHGCAPWRRRLGAAADCASAFMQLVARPAMASVSAQGAGRAQRRQGPLAGRRIATVLVG